MAILFYALWLYCSKRLLHFLAFLSVDFDRTCWRLILKYLCALNEISLDLFMAHHSWSALVWCYIQECDTCLVWFLLIFVFCPYLRILIFFCFLNYILDVIISGWHGKHFVIRNQIYRPLRKRIVENISNKTHARPNKFISHISVMSCVSI